MKKAVVLLALMSLGAQQAPKVAPKAPPAPAPVVVPAPEPGPAPRVTIDSPEDRATLDTALADLAGYLMSTENGKARDPDTASHTMIIRHELAQPSGLLSEKSVPIAGMALSRASGCDDNAWLLLQKILGPPMKGEIRHKPDCVNHQP